MVLAAFIFLIVALLIGVPIALALAGSAALGLWAITGSLPQVLAIAGTNIYSSVSDYTLTSVPMFILMAYLTSQSGIAHDLFKAGSSWLSSLRGGLAIATVFATAVFGAMSGASVAAAAVMAEIAYPEMRKAGYSEELATGVISVGSTTNILIPPSIALIVYGLLTDTSLGALLVAGILPGIVLALVLALVIVAWVSLQPSIAPATRSASWQERWRSLAGVWPSVVLILAVMVLLYSGIATPTEIGALGALVAAIIGFLLRRLTWKAFLGAVMMTIRSTAMIFVIFVGAKFFGYFVTLTQVPQHLVDIIVHLEVNRWVVILGVIVSYFVVSMFMDEVPLMMLTLPLSFPVVTALGFDPVWFGILTMMMVAMGLVFPPVGMVAFVVSAASGADLVKVYKGCAVLIMAIFITTALLMVFPQLALFLPATMR